MSRTAVVVGVATALVATCASAHHATPEQVVARLKTADVRASFDVTRVERSRELPRMLVVRVGTGWAQVDPVRRVETAEEWYTLWRDAVPNGILAIVDAADRPLVNFDPGGRARLQKPAAHATAGAPPR
jgi:hypothetical protein